jgi:hypothetical protein
LTFFIVPAESIGEESDELEHFGLDAGGPGDFVEVHLGGGAEVEEREKQSADEEEGVDREGGVADGLEEELALHHAAEVGVVRILEDDDARVTQNHPDHAQEAQPVDRRQRVATHTLHQTHSKICFSFDFKK